MNKIFYAIHLGLIRGWIDFKHTLRYPQELGFNIVLTLVLLVVLYFQRDKMIEGLEVSLAMASLPSLIGMLIAFGCLMGAATQLAYEREDGTLLRAKATPNGMAAYLVSRIISSSAYVILTIAMLLIPGLLMINGLAEGWLGNLLLFTGIMVLGILATLPWGAIIGSLVKNAASGFNLTILPVGALAAISGIFYPIAHLAGWIQTIAQIFPVYWLGLGMRSVFLPDAAAAAEIGGSWRPVETLIVLGLWAVAGLLVAPRILRRMANREAGSVVDERKQAALNRGY